MEIPHSDVSVGAAGEADLGVRADGQSVTRRRRGRQLRLDPRSRRGQIPDGQSARLAAHNQSPAVWQEPTGADVVVSVLMRQAGACESLQSEPDLSIYLSIGLSVYLSIYLSISLSMAAD